MKRFAQLSLAIVLVCLSAVPVVGEDSYSVSVFKDVPYLENAGYPADKDKLDLYLPQGLSSFPVLVFLHGGALMKGDKNQQGHVGQRFAEEGFGVVAVNYRLSPGVAHPAHIEDAAASFAWVYKNIGRYSGNPKQIIVAGHSAGAYLAALLALEGRYLKAHGLDPSHMRAVIPISGFFHVDRVAPERPKSVWGEDSQAWLDASPAKYASHPAPPMLFLYADSDTAARRKESEDMALLLREAGNPRALTQEIAHRDHLSIWMKLGVEGDETAPRMVKFMRQVLAGNED